MSTEARFDAAVFEAMKDVRSDANDVKYVICGHVDGNPNHIGLISTGTDTAELAKKMDPTENLYALGRYEAAFGMPASFVYFVWQGAKVPFLKRGRYGIVSGSIEERFRPHLIQLTTSSTEEMGKEYVLQKLKEFTGTNSKEEQGNVTSQRDLLPREETKKSAKYVGISVTSEVHNAVAKVTDDAMPETWMVAGYANANPTGPIACVGIGCGGLQEMKDCLTGNNTMYMFFRLTYKDQNGITAVKFILLTWVGPNVTSTFKAKVATHKALVEDTFMPCHVIKVVENLSEIDEAALRSEMDKKTTQ